MDIIEEHPFTQEELIRLKGEETTKFIHYVYSRILLVLLYALVFFMFIVCVRMLKRIYNWSTCMYENWCENRLKQKIAKNPRHRFI